MRQKQSSFSFFSLSRPCPNGHRRGRRTCGIYRCVPNPNGNADGARRLPCRDRPRIPAVLDFPPRTRKTGVSRSGPSTPEKAAALPGVLGATVVCSSAAPRPFAAPCVAICLCLCCVRSCFATLWSHGAHGARTRPGSPSELARPHPKRSRGCLRKGSAGGKSARRETEDGKRSTGTPGAGAAAGTGPIDAERRKRRRSARILDDSSGGGGAGVIERGRQMTPACRGG